MWWTLQYNAAVLSIQCPRNINSNTISYLPLILAGIHRLQLKFPIPKIDSDPGHTSLQRVALWPGFCPICNSIPSIVFDLLITITLWIYPSSIAIPRPNISQLWGGRGVVYLPCCYSLFDINSLATACWRVVESLVKVLAIPGRLWLTFGNLVCTTPSESHDLTISLIQIQVYLLEILFACIVSIYLLAFAYIDGQVKMKLWKVGTSLEFYRNIWIDYILTPLRWILGLAYFTKRAEKVAKVGDTGPVNMPRICKYSLSGEIPVWPVRALWSVWV